MTTLVAADVMERWAAEVLQLTGLRPSDARWVATNLLFADRRGVRTHGLMRLPTYVERIRGGEIKCEANCRVETDLGALVILDADDAPGAASAVLATEIVVERARRHGVGCVIARNANHFGASAFYTNQIADADLIGIAICNTESVMCAPFGGRPVLGTNPLAVAIPLPEGVRPQLDMATTTASHGKLIMAREAGHPIPLGWAVDSQGRPTQSAAEGLAGALLPSGGPKGFGIAFAIDSILAVSGANTSQDVGALHGDAHRPQKLGHAFVALRADVVGPIEHYRAKIAALVDAIHNSGVPDGELPPLAPGEPEQTREREAGGRIQLSERLVRDLAQLGHAAGAPFPSAATI